MTWPKKRKSKNDGWVDKQNVVIQKMECYSYSERKIILQYAIIWMNREDITCVLKSLQSCPTLWDSMDCSVQAPLSMGFSTQEYWSGLPCPPPGDLPDPGIKPTSLMSPALAGRFFTTSATWKPICYIMNEPWGHYAKRNSQSSKDKYCLIPLTWST